MKSKPLITINLKPHLADYCRYVLKTDKEGNIILRRSHNIGKLIFSMIEFIEFPKKRPFIDNPCTFVVPLIDSVQLQNRFLNVPRWKEEQIEAALQHWFNLDATAFFKAGYEKNYPQKRIIEAFLCGYNIKNTSLSYESVKKNDYRKRIKEQKSAFEDIEKVMYQ